MSFKKICICDCCGKEINEFDIDECVTGYCHTCEECKIKLKQLENAEIVIRGES